MSEQKATNITAHAHSVTKEERWKLMGHKGCVLWFTGLSACGKSTVANAVDRKLHDAGVHTAVLDGDNIRFGLNKNLGFSADDRAENIRRIGEVAKLFMEAGVIVLTAFISPFRSDRERVRGMVEHGDFIEIFCDSPIEICESRDVKGIYKKARAGQIADFTGISSPYEFPEKPELNVNTGEKELDACVQQVIDEMMQRSIIARS